MAQAVNTHPCPDTLTPPHAHLHTHPRQLAGSPFWGPTLPTVQLPGSVPFQWTHSEPLRMVPEPRQTMTSNALGVKPGHPSHLGP